VADTVETLILELLEGQATTPMKLSILDDYHAGSSWGEGLRRGGRIARGCFVEADHSGSRVRRSLDDQLAHLGVMPP
jgi:hypothetical protein